MTGRRWWRPPPDDWQTPHLRSQMIGKIRLIQCVTDRSDTRVIAGASPYDTSPRWPVYQALCEPLGEVIFDHPYGVGSG